MEEFDLYGDLEDPFFPVESRKEVRHSLKDYLVESRGISCALCSILQAPEQASGHCSEAEGLKELVSVLSL